MYWGNAAATDASSGSSVFSSGNYYSAVWHMNQTTAINEPDATGYATNQTAVVTGTPTIITGPGGVPSSVGKSLSAGSFYVVNNSGAGSNLDFPTGGPYTLSCWINPTSTTLDTEGIIGKMRFNATSTSGTVYRVGTYALEYRNTANNLEFMELKGTGNNYSRIYANPPSTANAWHHIVEIRNGTGATTACLALYVDDTLRTATYDSTNASDTLTDSLAFL